MVPFAQLKVTIISAIVHLAGAAMNVNVSVTCKLSSGQLISRQTSSYRHVTSVLTRCMTNDRALFANAISVVFFLHTCTQATS